MMPRRSATPPASPACAVVRPAAPLQGLLPSLSARGLAAASEALALMRAGPPTVFVDILLTSADKKGLARWAVVLYDFL
jgi:hypothetical protein